MITSQNGFTQAEQVSLSNELVVLGIKQTPLTSLLLSKGNLEKAMSVVHSWTEKTLDTTEDISFAEGSETTVFQQSVKRQLSNILQIFKKAVSISGTAIAMNGGKFSEEIADRLLELKMALENTLINGKMDTGSTTGIRKMSGLIEFSAQDKISVANDPFGAIKQGMKKLWDDGIAGGEFYLFVNADFKEALDAVFQDSYSYQHTTTNFGLLVSTLSTNFGLVNVVLSKWIPAQTGVLFNDAFVDLVALREATFEPLAKTSDGVKGQVVGEYSLKVATDKAIVVIEDTTV